jgi:cell division transport system ATP-binding protein
MISLEHVTKTYKAGRSDEIVALKDVSIDIERGEFVFIVGPSGSGKSTFMKLLTREVRPDSGTIHVAGKDLNTLRSWKLPALRRDIGYVFQDFKLLVNKTVSENVAFALEVIGMPSSVIDQRVPEVLELVDLTAKADAMPLELSGGQQQRVSIARAFVNQPPILLCDEPTGNLDPQTSIGIMKLLDRINRTNTTVVMATHDQHIVDSMRKRVIELSHGTVVRDQARGVYGYAN